VGSDGGSPVSLVINTIVQSPTLAIGWT